MRDRERKRQRERERVSKSKSRRAVTRKGTWEGKHDARISTFVNFSYQVELLQGSHCIRDKFFQSEIRNFCKWLRVVIRSLREKNCDIEFIPKKSFVNKSFFFYNFFDRLFRPHRVKFCSIFFVSVGCFFKYCGETVI